MSRYILVGIDCHILPRHFIPQNFWRQALARAQEATSDDEAVCQQMDVVTKNQSGLPWKDFKYSYSPWVSRASSPTRSSVRSSPPKNTYSQLAVHR